MKVILKSKRIQFFLKHLFTSCFIALIASYFIFFIWYPYPLAKAVGVLEIVAIVFAIDIIIGPILGLVVYNEGKKTLKFDLFVIFLFQFLAFSYGFYTLNKARPLYFVLTAYNFETVRNNELINSSENPSLNFKLLEQPKFVGLNHYYAENSQNTNSLRNPIFYKDIISTADMGEVPLLNLELLSRYNSKESIKEVLKKYPSADSWVGLRANYNNMVVLLAYKEQKVLGVVDLRPW